MSRTNLALVALLAVVAVVSSVAVHAAGPCMMLQGFPGGTQYNATWSTSLHTGDPTAPCLKGYPVYEFHVSVSGSDGSSGSDTFLVCAALSNSVTLYDSAGTAHTFEPKARLTWGDVHSSTNCKVIKWTM